MIRAEVSPGARLTKVPPDVAGAILTILEQSARVVEAQRSYLRVLHGTDDAPRNAARDIVITETRSLLYVLADALDGPQSVAEVCRALPMVVPNASSGLLFIERGREDISPEHLEEVLGVLGTALQEYRTLAPLWRARSEGKDPSRFDQANQEVA